MNTVLVESDRSKMWWYGFTMMPPGAAAMFLIVGVAMLAGEVSLAAFPVVWLLGTVLVFLYAFGCCLTWRFTVAETSYRIDDEYLYVLRGEKVLRSIPRAEILDVSFFGYMRTRHTMLHPFPPPLWPAARIVAHDGKGKHTILLPEVMLLGQEAVTKAEASMRSVLRGHTAE